MCAQLLSTHPYKGTRDFYPADMMLRNWFFGKIRSALEVASFEEYNGPMLESLEIYIAKSGEEIANEHPEYLICKVNVDEALPLAIKYGVESIPNLVAIKNGEMTGRIIGMRPKEAIVELLK